MTKITATVPVYAGSHLWPIEHLRELAERGEHERLVRRVMLHDMSDAPDYVLCGTAEVTVTLMSPSETAAAEVAALNAQLDAARAEFQEKQAEILERISKLQALESSVEVA